MTTETRHERFSIADFCRLDLRLASGNIEMVEGATGEVTVDLSGPDATEFQIEQQGDRVIVQPRLRFTGQSHAHSVRIAVPPAAASVHAQIASADLTSSVELAALSVIAASGDVNIQDVAGSASAKLASGDLNARRVSGRLDVTTASGAVTVAAVHGPAGINTASGNVHISEAAATLNVKSASGDIRIDSYRGPDFSCKTLSGDVRLVLPPGCRVDVDLQTLTGSIRNEFDVDAEPAPHGQSAAARIHARSMSGDMLIARSREPAASNRVA
jgi:DUF4097 and DUF4098 domain-containing protein YvlB